MSKATDAIALLEADHDTFRRLFEMYAALGGSATVAKERLARRMTRELAVHVDIEEKVVYPRAREVGRQLKDETLEALEEHHLIKVGIGELEGMTPEDERFDAKLEVLREHVEHHVDEEEAEMFPRLRAALDPVELRDMAAAIDAARSEAPTHTCPDGGGFEVTEHDGRRVVVRTPTAGEEDAARIESEVQQESDAEVTRHPTLRK